MDTRQLGGILKSKSNKKPTEYPGMWQFPSNLDQCCIYRVPGSLRRVNPEAYTPQLVIIGPLHHSLKSLALSSRGDITNTKLMGYLNIEEHKKIYLAGFAQRLDGAVTNVNATTVRLRTMIEEEEEKIRQSYSESTAWIESPEFVEMIMYDSVFILEFILRTYRNGRIKRGDPLIDEPCLTATIVNDIILLENQLPYFILEKLFNSFATRLVGTNGTFRELTLIFFGFRGKIRDNSKFKHFTDMYRCVHVETLPELAVGESKIIKHMYNADKLHGGGVKFKVMEEEFSLNVSFENGCLRIPFLWVRDDSEMVWRNIMALEQCHYPYTAHACNYIMFLDFLIDTNKDVDLLVDKGIIKNWMGEPDLVVDMVNKLGSGIIDSGSYYSDIAIQVNAHYLDPKKRSCAALKRVYFSNLWKGTATVAAMLLLLFTLIQAVTSILDVVL